VSWASVSVSEYLVRVYECMMQHVGVARERISVTASKLAEIHFGGPPDSDLGLGNKLTQIGRFCPIYAQSQQSVCKASYIPGYDQKRIWLRAEQFLDLRSENW
jgi:hypothetical protein